MPSHIPPPPTHCAPMHAYHLQTQRIEDTDLEHEQDSLFSYQNISGLADPYEIGAYVVGSTFPTLITDPSYLGEQAALRLASGLNATNGNTVVLPGTQNALADDAAAAKVYTNKFNGQIIRTQEPIYTTPYHKTVIATRAKHGEHVPGNRHMTQSVAAVRNFREYQHELNDEAIARIRGHQMHRPVLGNNSGGMIKHGGEAYKGQFNLTSGFAPCAIGGSCNPMRPSDISGSSYRSQNKKKKDWAEILQLTESYINQGHEELCVAASFCLVLFWMSKIYNLGSKINCDLNDLNNSPCWEDAYLRQRMYEAQESGRCKCDLKKNTCDNCGSTISAALSVLQDTSRGFVSRNNKLKYFIREMDNTRPETLIISAQELKQALEKGPVICNMYIRKSQAKFLDKPSHDSYMYGNDKIKKYGNDGVYDSTFQFPPTNMDEPRERFGHCVVIVGFKEEEGEEGKKEIKFRVRNSFGRFWGHFGDFYLTDQHIHPETVHQLLFIPSACIQLQKLF